MVLIELQSDMYQPNDALIEGHRLSNLFNTQDNAWHDKCESRPGLPRSTITRKFLRVRTWELLSY